MKKSLSAQQLLSSQAGSQMRQIVHKIKEIEALNQTIKQYLPADFAAHCRVLNLDKGKLTLEVNNSSWASKLRFQKSDLLDRLRAIPAFSGISTIHHLIKSSEIIATKPTAKPSQKRLGQPAVELLKSMAEQTQDPELKQQLEKFLLHQQL